MTPVETYTREDMARAYALGYEDGQGDGGITIWDPRNPWGPPDAR